MLCGAISALLFTSAAGAQVHAVISANGAPSDLSTVDSYDLSNPELERFLLTLTFVLTFVLTLNFLTFSILTFVLTFLVGILISGKMGKIR